MYKELQDHIKRFVGLKEEEAEKLSSLFASFSVKKKIHLLSEGQVCRANYFVVKGCLRMYFIDLKGAEQTVQFAIEDWWMTDYTSFQFQNASQFYIQATEETEILAIGHQQQDELFNAMPKMERYFRLILQKSHAASQMRIKYLYSMTGEERYRQFAKLFPEFVQRIPQYMLASYLGFTPEFLSKIRKRK